MDETIKCYKCELRLQGKPMEKISEIHNTPIQMSRMIEGGNVEIYGMRNMAIYQCETCKSIKCQ